MKLIRCKVDHFKVREVEMIQDPIAEFPMARWSGIVDWYKAGIQYAMAESVGLSLEDCEESEHQLFVPNDYGIIQPMNVVPPWKRENPVFSVVEEFDFDDISEEEEEE